ncbi:hypothetical protein [Kitasatospora cathayae]|uniref:MFS transporter n=1 Tax=Kitasatospora cathayae TaxID=3004092 RepID=A0ABY7Q165_9ACTN|nr:hypothetical protein [Kitasatospora sp. HUAS 3-15]WBP86448.1 hypothetical protein O1G21_11775 [Kitasatospora sp. HUAS 3-15]
MAQALPRRRNRLALALGVGQLLLAVPMLLPIVLCALVVGTYGLALGGLTGLVFPLLLVGGPLLGLGLAALIARAQKLPGETAFAVMSSGLLLGASVVNFGWLHQAGVAWV